MKTRGLTWVLIILGLLITAALITPPVLGASDKLMTIKNMKVSVWPEYDDSRVLVIYQGEFKDGSIFPQPVAFPVPLGSEINQVCALKPPNDEHLCQLYDTLATSDALSVSYTLPIPTYYLEYYWDGIKGLPEKSFTFKYVSPYAADTLELEVQQPLKATDFKLAQPYASASSDSLGMKYYHYVFNNVTAGQVISVGASYNKPDAKPSVVKTQGSSAGGSGAGGAGGGSSYSIIFIGVVIMAVAVIGFVLFRRKPVTAPVRVSRAESRRTARTEAKRIEARSAHRPEAHAPAAVPGPGTGVVFCSHCGTKLAAGAAFCHACGNKAGGSA